MNGGLLMSQFQQANTIFLLPATLDRCVNTTGSHFDTTMVLSKYFPLLYFPYYFLIDKHENSNSHLLISNNTLHNICSCQWIFTVNSLKYTHLLCNFIGISTKLVCRHICTTMYYNINLCQRKTIVFSHTVMSNWIP